MKDSTTYTVLFAALILLGGLLSCFSYQIGLETGRVERLKIEQGLFTIGAQEYDNGATYNEAINAVFEHLDQ